MSAIVINNAPSAPIHSPFFILNGTVSSKADRIVVSCPSYLDQSFEINNKLFKAIVQVSPGLNRVRLTAGDTSVGVLIEYVPLVNNPPLHLCLLVAKDSPLTFDSPPELARKEGNGLDVLIRKLQIAGRLMQMFTQQEMARAGFGNRVFNFVEEHQVSGLVKFDIHNGIKRSNIKVHVIRSSRTMKELRDPNIAQQNSKGTLTGKLFDIALDELRKLFPIKSEPLYLAVMFLDAHWDPKLNLILTHAALGGGTDDIKLLIFGSHGLWSWPQHVDDLHRYFTDETRTDTRYVANDCNECSSIWECVNITIGLFMHEIGHLYGCPHQENGIMLRDYVTFNRTFMTRESKCIRTNRRLWSPVTVQDECHWHRFDLLRFLYHPAFALPQDFSDDSFKPSIIWNQALKKLTPLKPSVLPISPRAISLEAKAGIYLVTFHVGEWSKYHLEFIPRSIGGPGPQRSVVIDYDEIQKHLAPEFRNKRVDIEILSNGGEQTRIDDLAKFLQQNKSFTLQIPHMGSRQCLKSANLGQVKGQESPLAVFGGFQVTRVRIHHGSALDGLEFFGIDISAPPLIPPRNYKSSSLTSGIKKLMSNTPLTPAVKEVRITSIGFVTNHYTDFTIHSNESIVSFNVRCGAWIDAIQVVLDSGRTSGMFGGTGGGQSELKPPEGRSIVGLYGSLDRWMNSIGIIYT